MSEVLFVIILLHLEVSLWLTLSEIVVNCFDVVGIIVGIFLSQIFFVALLLNSEASLSMALSDVDANWFDFDTVAEPNVSAIYIHIYILE